MLHTAGKYYELRWFCDAPSKAACSSIVASSLLVIAVLRKEN